MEQTVHTTASNRKIVAPSPKKCLLLSLPAELRTRIYEYAMCSDSPCGIGVSKQGIEKGGKLGALIFTCRQIKNEALPVYFKVNAFRFDYEEIRNFENGLYYEDGAFYLNCLSKHIKSLKDIRIPVGQNIYLRIDLSDGLSKMSAQLIRSNGASLPSYPQPCPNPYPHPCENEFVPRMIRYIPKVRRFFEEIVTEGDQQGTKPSLDKDKFVELLMLVDNGVWEIDIRMRAGSDSEESDSE